MVVKEQCAVVHKIIVYFWTKDKLKRDYSGDGWLCMIRARKLSKNFRFLLSRRTMLTIRWRGQPDRRKTTSPVTDSPETGTKCSVLWHCALPESLSLHVLVPSPSFSLSLSFSYSQDWPIVSSSSNPRSKLTGKHRDFRKVGRIIYAFIAYFFIS